LITKVGLSARFVAEETLGPRYWTAKLIGAAVLLLLLYLTNFGTLFNNTVLDMRPTYRVTAPFTFGAVDKRTLSAPYDGYIYKVMKKPGDIVKAGDTLMEMDTRDITLKMLQAQSEAISHLREADKYRVDDDKIAEYKVARAQADQSQAQADLYKWQIDHATVTAPLDGIVLKGDLEDKLGSAVKQGDELMVVADGRNLRAELSANERDIQELKEGQVGKLATTSLPTSKFACTIDRIIPLGMPKEGSNVFTVYATLNEKSPGWRPGMAGEARIDVEKRTWAWIWTHRLFEFVRLKTWM